MNSSFNSSEDIVFSKPCVLLDEWRDKPERHRYVFGGFADTELRFSFHFPTAERYKGRFFQPIPSFTGASLAETSHFALGFAFSSGGYLAQSNLGSLSIDPGPDPTVAAFRASAASATFGRLLAVEMYGGGRPYGYVWGTSGGALKTIGCMENTDVWDGAVPIGHDSPHFLPGGFCVQAHALRLLQGNFDAIRDAVDPGGSGDMYAGLNDEQREGLLEVTRFGFPPRAWFAHEALSKRYTELLGLLARAIHKTDPSYFSDFWTVPGYLGADPPPSLLSDRIQYQTRIVGIVKQVEAKALGLTIPYAAVNCVDAPVGIRIESIPPSRIQGARITMLSGLAEGATFTVSGVVDDVILIGYDAESVSTIVKIHNNDVIEVDNSDYLAIQTFHRHQMPRPVLQGWKQYLMDDGRIKFPQRPLLPSYNDLGSEFSSQSGRFRGKMIVLHGLMDEAAFVWNADWYRERVYSILGDRIDDQYRLWFVDHSLHASPHRYEGETYNYEGDTCNPNTRLIDVTGIEQQALRDVVAWVERGTQPSPSTPYKILDGQIFVSNSAARRMGLQPVVELTVKGDVCAHVSAGESVDFLAVAEVPPNTGMIVEMAWDFEGIASFDVLEIFVPAPHILINRCHTFSQSGTYFPVLRVTSQREGDAATLYGRIDNIARVRVVVA